MVQNREEVYNFHFYHSHFDLLCIHILPETVLSTDPIICALFGGAVMGLGIGLALRNGLSSGGLDIVSITIRKKQESRLVLSRSTSMH